MIFKKNKEKVELKTLEEVKQYSKKYHIIIGVLFVVVLVMGVLGYVLLENYEDAILKVYAVQQDSYVQLVVDQINIQDDRTDQEIITEIIDTLDSGSSHYWTLSKDDTLLFVKNVLETNKYQGVKTDDYFGTSTPSEFFDTFQLNRVQHMIVKIDGVKYVASGVLFQYNGENYRICLLTDEQMIFDNNEFLVNKIEMYLYAVTLLLIILIVALLFENIVIKRRHEIFEYDKKIRNLNLEIQELEKEINIINFYDSRWNLYNFGLIDKFLDKMDDRKIDKLTYVELQFSNRKNMQSFLYESEYKLDKNVLRFDKSETELVLLMVHLKEDDARDLLNQVDYKEYSVNKIAFIDGVDHSFRQEVEGINE